MTLLYAVSLRKRNLGVGAVDNLSQGGGSLRARQAGGVCLGWTMKKKIVVGALALACALSVSSAYMILRYRVPGGVVVCSGDPDIALDCFFVSGA